MMNDDYIREIIDSMSSDIDLLYSMDPIFRAHINVGMHKGLTYTQILEYIILNSRDYNDKIKKYKREQSHTIHPTIKGGPYND